MSDMAIYQQAALICRNMARDSSLDGEIYVLIKAAEEIETAAKERWALQGSEPTADQQCIGELTEANASWAMKCERLKILNAACVNAFHDPAGRKIATEDIGEAVVWRLINALRATTNDLNTARLIMDQGARNLAGEIVKENRTLLSSLKIQEPET